MKKLFSKIAALGALMVGAFAIGGTAHKAPVTANATKGAGDEPWSLIGSVKNPSTNSYTNWDTDIPFSYNSADSRYELIVHLEAGDEFKIRYNGGWSTQIAYGGNTGGGIGDYLQNSGGNFKVKTGCTDFYLLKIVDDNVAGYGDKSYGFSLETYTAKTHKVTYYHGSKKLTEVEVADGTNYNPQFVYDAGYRLEGWYTDSSLRTPYTQKALTTDLTLYGKYSEAENFELYIKNNQGWAQPYVYLWSNTWGHNNTWPGEAMTRVGTTNYWYVEIDTGYVYDSIIFGNGLNNDVSGAEQTVNLPLADETVIYSIGAKDSTGNFTATTEVVRKVVAHIPGDKIEWAELQYTGTTASKVGFSVLAFNDGRIELKETGITEDEMKNALIARMQDVDTCTDYEKYAEFRELAALVEDSDSIKISDRNKDEDGAMTATVTIGDKLAYMELLAGVKAANEEKANGNGIILSLTNENSNVSLIALFAILGLVAVSAYYFIEKKKLAK
ncbi:MAG: starch-binding protein [Erysipelotrichales bacterium]|nr:starch-binding protein [Erysipelotrichales bacterium]